MRLLFALSLGFGATAPPVWAAITIDQTPLLIAEPIPPNILFILDDSGSMGWEHMPGTTAKWYNAPVSGLPQTVSVNDIRLRAPNINTQWYNPLIAYEPWLKHDGSSYGNANYNASMSVDPSGSAASGSINFKTKFTSWVTLSTGTGTTGVGNTQAISSSTSNTSAGRTTGLVSANYQWRYSGFYYLTGANEKTVTNYTRYDFIYGCPVASSSCNNNQKQWRARQFKITNNNGVTGTETELTQFDWTPYGGVKRSVEQELQNYANWFVYYRLRINMAKAAASRAFASLSGGYRIGFDTLQYNSKSTTPIYPIPVGTNEGNFLGTNKQNWFTKLMATNAYNGTSLREALGRSGEYFSDKTTSYKTTNGPYGSGSGKPILSCRQNFAILTTDGYWNGNAATIAAANSDNDSSKGSKIIGVKGQEYTYEPKAPYKDSRGNTLADVAMYYWKNDLMPSMSNNVPTTGKNPAFWQHMRTFGISIGEKGTLDPQDTNTVNALYNGTKSWPQPKNDAQENIDDLWHASINSRGEFIVASNPEEFAKALTNTLQEIARETKSEASGGVDSAMLSADSKAFFSRYTSGSWNGDLFAYKIDESTGEMDQSKPLWEAENELPAWNQRTIYVNANGSMKTFEHGNLTATQKNHLNQNQVNYLRGDRSKEEKNGGTLRDRVGLLPDFVNSQLVYVGRPTQTEYFGKFEFTGASSYASYADSYKNRQGMVYIAGNDGMLHAFNSNTGKEVFAFMLSSAITSGKLSNYMLPDYGSTSDAANPHQYIFDGELTAADAYLGGQWKTILVATQGRGGTGVLALDVTDPSDPKFLWEKSSADSGALGYNLSKPIIAQVSDGNWRVLFGNGPNSTGDRAQLISISLSDGNITAVDTGAGSNNGLSGVSLWDQDRDGLFETAYAGDLRGNIWRFTNLDSAPSASKLFTTTNSRPISAPPLLITNQKTNDTWVFVGTGRYLNSDDIQNTDQQSWYGLIDDGTTINSRNQLMERKITSADEIGRIIETGSEAEITQDASQNRGWYIDFTKPGERMMTPNFVIGGALLGISFYPDSTDPCEPDGKSALWGVNPFSGARLNQDIFGVERSVLDGIPAVTSGAPPITIGEDGMFSIHLPKGTIEARLPTGQPGRESWREVIRDN